MTNIHHSAGNMCGGFIMLFRLLENIGGDQSSASGIGGDYIMGFGCLVDREGGTSKASTIIGASIVALQPLLPNQALCQACGIEVTITKAASVLDIMNRLLSCVFTTFELHLLRLH